MKKIGTFLGVFTPTVLTILGVIMYLRLGWVVGNVGLGSTILIVVLANAITLITTLSFSAIATNARVGVGGAYYMISRSLGLEFGGAIGLPLFLSQACSVTLYAFGLAESLRIVWPGVPVQVVASVVVVGAGLLAYRGAAIALRAQIPLMGLIAVSLIALGFGALRETPTGEAPAPAPEEALAGNEISTGGGAEAEAPPAEAEAAPPEDAASGAADTPDGLDDATPAPVDPEPTAASPAVEPGASGSRAPPPGFWVVFAVFFPAVTGIMAGLGLSGDLKDPMRSIPRGAIGAALVGFAIYLVVPVLLARGASADLLRSDPLVWTKIAPGGAWLILPGLFGAILSSAIGSVLTAPRTIQALAVDRIAPRFLARAR
ncbi:MAG TPA: hypothetical protein VKU85_16045, partial [bacterium]|nr:hypothetical protein [bacterium]